MIRKVLIKLFFLPLILFGQNNGESNDYNVYKDFMPSSTDSVIVHHNHYSYSFSKASKLTEWTIYFLTKERLTGNQFPRTNNFRDDPKLKYETVNMDDYRNSGYDRGHLVPARDMAFSKKSISESFYISNTNPQTPRFNRGINIHVENKIRDWVIEKDSLVIITGGILNYANNYSKEEKYFNIGNKKIPLARILKPLPDVDQNDLNSDTSDDAIQTDVDANEEASVAADAEIQADVDANKGHRQTIGNKRILVPSFYYKVIIDINEKSSIALVLPNYLMYYEDLIEYVCSISTLENLTGIDFFYKLPKDLELDFEDKHSLND